MNNQLKIPLYQALMEHANKNPISFHVPGHKYGSIFQEQAKAFSSRFYKLMQLNYLA